MISTHFNEMKTLINDIEKYIDENSNRIILYKIFKRPLRFFVKILKLSYFILNKNRINLETQKMLEQLKNEYNINIGDLIKIKETVVVSTETTTSGDNGRPHKAYLWKSLPPGEIVMFVGIENDTVNDASVLKVLSGETVFYIHRDPKILNLDSFLHIKFSKA